MWQLIRLRISNFLGAFANNGQPLSFSTSIYQPSSLNFNGWVVIDTLLIRLNTSFTPSGVFGDGKGTNGIGYDVGVCVEVFEPWVVETYNGTASTSTPRTNGIVAPGSKIHDTGGNSDDRALLAGGYAVAAINATGKDNVFIGVQKNARNVLLKVGPFQDSRNPSLMGLSIF